ncbi:unnamed protein product [Danaus chrysippus]|uniref:(African queen) hypothetical protein n=1 Tax=Danaus chrysippus TaxID=151541 RepID=A0A8J2QSG8_9NEOP|nr:unnamed protein product [Danaus chrysippus]
MQCDWPVLNKDPLDKTDPVYAMIIADTHLLGSRDGHWFDKWRREWQMHRGFQAAMTLHKPEVVFVLGKHLRDLFDEGKWCSQKEFDEYVERFHRLFKIPVDTKMYTVVGNHDIGFHYRITPQLANRFEEKMKSPPVQLVSIRGNHFVLLNSMAMEGDGCTFCSRAVAEIDKIADIMKCSSGSKLCKGREKLQKYSKPIILQHYPLYRVSDGICKEPNVEPWSRKSELFIERWDCLSRESTEYLVESLQPRVVFGAHTHHGCKIEHSFMPTRDHKIEFTEYTVPSFSWRNSLEPEYYLVSINTSEVKVLKCELPSEWSIQLTAVILIIVLLVYIKYFSRVVTGFNHKQL